MTKKTELIYSMGGKSCKGIGPIILKLVGYALLFGAIMAIIKFKEPKEVLGILMLIFFHFVFVGYMKTCIEIKDKITITKHFNFYFFSYPISKKEIHGTITGFSIVPIKGADVQIVMDINNSTSIPIAKLDNRKIATGYLEKIESDLE